MITLNNKKVQLIEFNTFSQIHASVPLSFKKITKLITYMKNKCTEGNQNEFLRDCYHRCDEHFADRNKILWFKLLLYYLTNVSPQESIETNEVCFIIYFIYACLYITETYYLFHFVFQLIFASFLCHFCVIR